MATDPQSAAAIPSEPAGLFEWHRAIRVNMLRPGMNLTTLGALFLVSTYAHTETGGRIFPSLLELSERTGLPRDGIAQQLRKAEALGWIAAVSRSTNRATEYQLTIPVGAYRTEDALPEKPGTHSPEKRVATTRKIEEPVPEKADTISTVNSSEISPEISPETNPWAKAPSSPRAAADHRSGDDGGGADFSRPSRPTMVEIVDLPGRDVDSGEDRGEDEVQNVEGDEPPLPRFGDRSRLARTAAESAEGAPTGSRYARTGRSAGLP